MPKKKKGVVGKINDFVRSDLARTNANYRKFDRMMTAKKKPPPSQLETALRATDMFARGVARDAKIYTQKAAGILKGVAPQKKPVEAPKPAATGAVAKLPEPSKPVSKPPIFTKRDGRHFLK